MDIKKISPKFSVSPQITADDVPKIKAEGYRAIICNRPDGEETDQPSFAEIEASAKAEGIEILYMPVKSGMVSEEDVEAFGAAFDELPSPLLAYCRSGTRSARLWSLYETNKWAGSETPFENKSADYGINYVALHVS